MKNPYEVSQQKLIYIFRATDDEHRGLLKIGDTTFNGGNPRLAAHKRIRSYMVTAGVPYELLHTEEAVDDNGNAFRDYDVHRVLENSNVKKISPSGTKAREWFAVDLTTARQAITAVKQGKSNLSGVKMVDKLPEVIFRAEQEDAISRTVKFFKTNDRFLWNAKMRFGKTLCALEVVRRMNFDKTIIVTHRPVVDFGWYDDFTKIFRDGTFDYGRVDDFRKLTIGVKHFVLFASIQDLRGSETVGGKFIKNAEIFSTDWNCVIVDEAHEGTQTALGDRVISELVKPATKFLALSGTPFNILDDFDEDAIFTWDYIDEQRAKANWFAEHGDDSNPYEDLPQMNIFTYDLGELLNNPELLDDDKTFNFREFFRTEGDDFAHAADVEKFLDLLVTRDANNYPYANKNFRDMFSHTLWIVPGVKAGLALSAMLQSHRVFHAFKVVNVAGDGDSDDEPADALDKVQSAIKNYPCTITLSCGKLTAGVTVPEWSAVFMLAGGYSTSAMNYLQTIFRVQSPCRRGGVVKTNCYVFDFAPDRTLRMVAESVAVSARAGKTTDAERQTLADMLNFCPVIAMHGSRMEQLKADNLLQQLKRAYIDRVVRRGFDDNYLYNDELLKLDDIDLEKFNKLGNLVGSSKAQRKTLVINDQGLTGAEVKKLRDNLKREPTPDERELARRKRKRLDAIRILRGISIRMPLLIYGADVPLEDDITIDEFADLIDDASWAEFMPRGVTKEIFADFIKFYDRDIFIQAGHQIRQQAKRADDLAPTERVKRIAELFATFKNPDKETVLTPWRVVDLHLSAALGDFFADDKKILEINSKTGLYPLWVAQRIYRQRLRGFAEGDFTPEKLRNLWDTTVAENVFVICKTPMAKKITRRTLLGYRNGTVNAEYFDDLINTLKQNPAAFINRITAGTFWSKGADKMKFDAVVGNPPYQNIMDNTSDEPIYNYFIDAAFQLADKVSLIHPARCLFNAGKTPKDFNRRLLSNKHVKIVLYESDSSKLFPSSDIKGGVAVTLYDANENFGAIGTFISFAELESIHRKVVIDNKNFQSLSEIIYPPEAFHFTKKFHDDNPNAARALSDGHADDLTTNVFEKLPDIFLDDKPDDGHDYIQIYGLIKMKRAFKWIRRDYVRNETNLDKYKVFVPKSNGSGALGEVVSTPLVGSPLVGSTQTFITVGAFDTLAEAEACLSYIKSKFARVMLGVLKVTQDNKSATWAKVPLQNFTAASDIDWSKPVAEIDAQLYRKYNLTSEEIAFIESHVKAMD